MLSKTEVLTSREIIASPERASRAVLSGLERAKLYLSSPRSAESYGGPKGYKLRVAGFDDCPALASLYTDAFPGYPFSSLVQTSEGHLSFLKDTSQIRVLVVKEEQIVGAAAMGTIPPDLSAEIKQVVIHPNERRKGLSFPLILSLIETSKVAHLQYLYMDVRSRMISMQKTALAAGFIAVGYRPGQHIVYHADPGPRREHMIHMLLTLNGAGKYLDEQKYQNIEPKIIGQLKEAGLNISSLQNHPIWKA